MKFVISQEDLKNALVSVVGTIERKTMIPVLSNVLIESTGVGSIRLTGTDLDITIQRTVPAKVETAGAICVNARKLSDLVRNMSAADLTFAIDEKGWVRLSAGKSKFRFAALQKDQFPETPTFKATPILLNGDMFRELIHKTQFAITHEASRFTLSGAKFEMQDQKVRMITTDGHRLSFTEKAIESDASVDVLIPRKALLELQKIDAEEINFGSDERHLYFATGELQVISRRLTGNFPNYEMVMPKDNDKRAVMSCEDLKAALRRASLMADEKGQKVTLRFAVAEVTVSAKSSEEGDATETLNADYGGEPVEIGFNWHYVLDFFNYAPADKSVAISFRDAGAQVEFTVDGEGDWKYVVMPLR